MDFPSSSSSKDPDIARRFDEASSLIRSDMGSGRARELLEENVVKGDAASMVLLGYVLADGDDPARALDLFLKAADMGDSSGMRNAGYCYAVGKGCERDKMIGAMWYTRAAEAGNAAACCNIGVMYDYGNGVEKSPTLAVAWFQRGAEGGNRRSMTNLGEHCMTGEGLESRDLDAAEYWLLKSGSPRAMYRLAELCLDYPEKRDAAKGQEYLERSAEAKYPQALYRRGMQLEPDFLETAKQMYAEAAAKGSKEARDRLVKMGVEPPESAMEKRRKAKKRRSIRAPQGVLRDKVERDPEQHHRQERRPRELRPEGERPYAFRRVRQRKGFDHVADGIGHGSERKHRAAQERHREDDEAVERVHPRQVLDDHPSGHAEHREDEGREYHHQDQPYGNLHVAAQEVAENRQQ